ERARARDPAGRRLVRQGTLDLGAAGRRRPAPARLVEGELAPGCLSLPAGLRRPRRPLQRGRPDPEKPRMTLRPETPPDSPMTMEEALASPVYRDLSTPKLSVGDQAFDFELPAEMGETVRLSGFRGVRPVALVFGSYT